MITISITKVECYGMDCPLLKLVQSLYISHHHSSDTIHHDLFQDKIMDTTPPPPLTI